MSVVQERHEKHGATYEKRGGRRVVAHYGRPERAHQAVRNGVGVIEAAYGVVVVEGDDRVDYVDNAVSNRIPAEDGEGCYALLLDPQGAITTDMYVYNAGERLLVFVPPGRAAPLAEEWSEKIFIEDVSVRVATDEFGIFGVHGPNATEKIASVLNGAASPDRSRSFVRGTMRDAGVTVVRTDAPAGEESYEVVCVVEDADAVFDALLNHGLNAAAFGHRTWETLTLEAGTPLFESELEGRIPNVVGVRSALDFEKGCYVGQEVVSRIENRGHPNQRLVGLQVSSLPRPGAAVVDGDAAVGEVTRAAKSPTLDEPIALALVETDHPDEVTVNVDGEPVEAAIVELPFVEGSERSARIPAYP